MPNQKPKPRKAGRPPLPKGNAKAVMVRVRVTQDERAAIEWYERAAKQGMKDAQCALGLIFEHGLGVPID